LQHDPKFSGGEGLGSRQAEHALVRITPDGSGSIYRKVIEMLNRRFDGIRRFGVYEK
jgi:hypothetical protein